MKLSPPTAATVDTTGARVDAAISRASGCSPTSARSMLWGYDTQVFPACRSIRMRVVKSGRSGADIATAPFEVPQALVKHPLTDAGFKRFADDWEEAKPHLGEILPSMQEA
jgi:hypothetical protein